MEFVKKNIPIVVCCVLIVLAMIIPIFPVSGMNQAVQEKLDAAVRPAQQLATLRQKQRTWPVTKLGQTEPEPLNRFPSQLVINQGKQVTDAIVKQSINLLELAMKLNEHKRLDTDAFRFRREYTDAVRVKLPADLNATTPPTAEQIAARKLEIFQRDYEPRIYIVQGKEENREEIQQEFDRNTATLPQEMAKERAEQFKTYLSKDAIQEQTKIIEDLQRQPSESEIWYAQHALWVQQDIAAAIARANRPSQSIRDSAVKHIKKLSVSPTRAQYVTAPVVPAAMGADLPATPGDPKGDLPTNYNISPTGRVSNGLYDVIRFDLEVIVDASKIPELLHQLSLAEPDMGSPSAFLTVTKLDVGRVNATGAAKDGYYYGERPVVEVTIQGEALMLRAWTLRDGMMPKIVKQELGLEQRDPNQQFAPAGDSGMGNQEEFMEDTGMEEERERFRGRRGRP